MLEDKIKMLRRAAKYTPKDANEEIWSAIAGNHRIINAVLVTLKRSSFDIKLIFRKHVTVESKHVHKKFDVIMLKGNPNQINELNEISKKYGGAQIRLTENYLKTGSNLMLIIGPDDNLREYVRDLRNSGIDSKVLLEDETHGFIETELQTELKIPEYIKTVIDPIFDASDIIIGNVLISITNKNDITMSKKLAKKNNIFLVDLEKLVNSVKQKNLRKQKEANKIENIVNNEQNE
ncbi:MAG: hypothetical protein Q4P14_04325 [Methanobacteriaceae archaeon]|nr:hypothetical protein [Methanobacteriaceae archaeon]